MNKKKLTIILLITIISTGFTQDKEVVEIYDPNFKNILLQSSVNRNKDQEIDVSEAMNFVNLDISNQNISSLLGIEAFSNLKHLDFSGNNVKVLDLSRNQNLELLVGDNNLLVYLEIRHNSKLRHISCRGNKLTFINLPDSDDLEYLKLSDNNLFQLDISALVGLTKLHISHNNLVHLNINNNTNLNEVLCDNNQLDNLDIRNNLNLKKLDCSYNSILNLDIRAHKALKVLNCNNNNLESLKINYLGSIGMDLQTMDASSNRALYFIYTNIPEQAKMAESRRFFLIDPQVRFIKHGDDETIYEVDSFNRTPYKIVCSITNYRICFNSVRDINSIHIEIYGLNGTVILGKTLLNKQQVRICNALDPGIYIAVFYIEGVSVRKLFKIDYQNNGGIIKVD